MDIEIIIIVSCICCILLSGLAGAGFYFTQTKSVTTLAPEQPSIPALRTTLAPESEAIPALRITPVPALRITS
jgi:hypothetical protein